MEEVARPQRDFGQGSGNSDANAASVSPTTISREDNSLEARVDRSTSNRGRDRSSTLPSHKRGLPYPPSFMPRAARSSAGSRHNMDHPAYRVTHPIRDGRPMQVNYSEPGYCAPRGWQEDRPLTGSSDASVGSPDSNPFIFSYSASSSTPTSVQYNTFEQSAPRSLVETVNPERVLAHASIRHLRGRERSCTLPALKLGMQEEEIERIDLPSFAELFGSHGVGRHTDRLII